MPDDVVRVVFYGKGGIGKSTVAAHVSAAWASGGARVLHVGCDPKMDSTIRLRPPGDFPAVVDLIEDRTLHSSKPERIVIPGRWGIDTVEAGGPEPGMGCAGRAVSALFDFFDRHRITQRPYDRMVFDVLGDLVCGGFVAPIRYGAGDRVVIVASGELMALYAANNIANVVLHHRDEGLRLAGIVYNVKQRDDRVDEALDRFTRRLNTRVLAWIAWDPVVREAERHNQTVIDYAPQSAAAEQFRTLARDLAAPLPAHLPEPTPMMRREFLEFGRSLDL